MRDVVALFVEASLAKGEWQAALSALQLSAATEGVLAAPAYFRLSGALAGTGAWAAALSVLRSAPAPVAGASSRSGRCAAVYLQGRVQAYQQVLTAYHAAAQPGTGDARASSKPDARAAAERMWALAKEALAVPGTPAPLPETPALPTPPASLASEACEGSVTSLLLWCRTALLPPQQPRSSSDEAAGPALASTAHEAEDAVAAAAAMQELTALSAAALRGLTEERESVDAPAAPATAAPPASPATPSAASSTAAPPRASAEAAAASPSRLKSDLRSLFDGNAGRARGAWATALGLVQELPPAQMSPRLFTALLRHLVQHRRRDEVIALACECLQLPGPADTASSEVSEGAAAPRETVVLPAPPPPAVVASLRDDSVVLKTVAEACHRLRCVELATRLLDPALASSLTPSAAVPLVMTLRDAGDAAAVVRWWAVLQHARGPQRYPLLKHAKLCSYVAACVLRSTTTPAALDNARLDAGHAAPPATGGSVPSAAHRQADWARVLAVFSAAEAPAHDPALVLLFQLRLLRQMRQWEAAVHLFDDFRAAHAHDEGRECVKPPSRRYRPSSSVSPRRSRLADQDGRPTAMESVEAVLTEERAEQWIPADALAQLCQRFHKRGP